MNKVGIYFAYWTKEWHADYRYYVNKVADLGFDILEVSTGHLLEMSVSKKMELKKIAYDRGIEMTYCIGFPADLDMASEDVFTRERGIMYAKRTLEAIHFMDGKIFGGINYSSWPGSLPQGAMDKSPYLERSITSIKQVVKTAEDYGIDYCIEVVNRFEQYLINTASEGVDFCEQVGSPNIKVLLDVFHMNIEEDSMEGAIVTAGKHLGHLHIGETNRKTPGTGRMPWDEIMTALRRIDYSGRIVMEPFVKMGGQVGRDIRVWRDLIGDGNGDVMDADAKASLEFIRRKMN